VVRVMTYLRVLLQTMLLQHPVELVRAEDAHEVIFKRQEELGVAGIPLAARTSTQLVVDAAAFVPFSPQNKEASGAERLVLEPCDLRANFVGARAFLA